MESTSPQGQEPQDDDEFPAAIILKDEGDRAEGTLVRYSEGPNRFQPGKSTVIAVLRDDDGRLGSLWLNSTVLVSKFRQLRPQPGERVEVVFKGERVGATSSYKDYRVNLPDRPPFVPNWDQVDTGGEDDVPGYYHEPAEGA